MVVYTVFSQNVSTFYKTTLCSKSTIFVVIITFLAFVLPLLIAYRSQGFWIKTMSYREQPTVRFKHEYYLHVEEIDANSNPIICSTVRQKTEELESLDKCSSIKFYEEDKNGDGKLDSLSMEIIITDVQPLPIQSIYLMLTFTYILQEQCLGEIEGVAVVSASSIYPAERLDVMGDLQLVQRSLLPCRGRHLMYNHSAFSDPYINVQTIARQHALQNLATRFGNEVLHWTKGEDTSFTMKLDLIYPEVTIQYRPAFWQVIKWAWIQYFAILVVFLAIHRAIKRYVFLNHLLPSVPVRPWKTS